MMLTNLADVLRAAGLKVQEVPGWKTRGHGQMSTIEGITCHHTAGPASGNYPSLGTVRDGRPGLDGPLAQLGLARDGTWLVIAAGLCWHAGVSFETWQTNPHTIGVEAEATGHDAWPAVQYESYVRGVRALSDAYDVVLSHVRGHKENAKPLGRKTDPNFNMDDFRAAVARGNQQGDDDDMPTLKEIEDADYRANVRYGHALFGPKGTGTAIWKAIRANGTAIAALAAAIKAEDTADDAALRSAVSELQASHAELDAAVQALADGADA